MMAKSQNKKIERRRRKEKNKAVKERQRKVSLQKRRDEAALVRRWPTFEIRFLDEKNKKVGEAISAAWHLAAENQHLLGDKADDLATASRNGFYKTEFGPYNWGGWLSELLYHQLKTLLPDHTLRRHDVQVQATQLSRGHVRIETKSLKSVAPFVACSPKCPQIQIDGKSYVAAFNLRDDDHFIRRLEERTVVDPGHDRGKGQVFGCLYHWQYFDPVQLANGQWAARLWNWCDPKIPLAEIWSQLIPLPFEISDRLGVKFYETDEGRVYYLVGYCPINTRLFDKGYAILNTLLLPGMDNTPEYSQLARGKSSVERAELARLAGRNTMRYLTESKNFEFIKELHSVAPQVKAIKDIVFDYRTK